MTLDKNLMILDSSMTRRVKNALLGLGLVHLQELDGYPVVELMRCRNFGKCSMKELIKYLEPLEICLNMGGYIEACSETISSIIFEKEVIKLLCSIESLLKDIKIDKK